MSSSRYIDLVVILQVADVERDPSGRPRWKDGSEEEILRIGGKWDRRKKKWSTKPATTALVMKFHRGQEPAIRWFAEWMRRYATNDWAGFARVWSVLLIGGRRSGKTHVACAVLFIFALLFPKAREWPISPTLETGDELDQAFREMIPRRWYERRQAKTGRATTYKFPNGSRLMLRSGVKPARLKAGRVDMGLLNETQEMTEAAYVKIRGAVVDSGGLVLMAANPPDAPSGKWVESHYLKAKAGEIESIVFELDPKRNPWINHEALASIASEIDEKTYQRDVLGLFAPIGDVVFHAWDDRENWKDPPVDLIDITAELTRRELGHASGYVVGQDFQRMPAMIGGVCRFFRDPNDPTGEPLLWVVDEALVEEADENDLLDSLESMPRWRPGDGHPDKRTHEETYRGWMEPDDDRGRPVHCSAVIDASGFFQDGAHTQGRTSDRFLKARRWIHLFKPQKDSDRNPAIVERMKVGNMLLKAANGRRRLFVAKHCIRIAEAMRSYEMKDGSPNRRSKYAHPVDAVTYVAYRFFGRPKTKSKPGQYHGVGGFDRGNDWRR